MSGSISSAEGSKPSNIPLSDNCNYYIPFPKYRTTSCKQSNRVNLFDPEKTKNRVQVVEYAVLVGDIREATGIYNSAQKTLICLLGLFVVLIIIFTYEMDGISLTEKLVIYGISLVIMLLMSLLINQLTHKYYRLKISEILKEHNESRYHRRGMHWNTDFEDKGWLHLQLNYNPATNSFGPSSNVSFAMSNTFFLDVDGNEIRFSGAKWSDGGSQGILKKPLLTESA